MYLNNEIKLATIEGKLEAVNSRFRHGSKQWNAARWIVRQDHEITTDERKALIQEIPIKYGSLTSLLTELRKMDLYPPQKISDISDRPLTPEIPQETRPQPPEKPKETLHQVPEAPKPSLPEYATVDDLNALRKDINFLAAVIIGEPPSNPDENPDKSDEEEEIEVITPEEMFIEDPSLTPKRVWFKPKTIMYFDLTRQGIFSSYADADALGPLTEFKGNLSDFINIITDDYFIRNYNIDIGLLPRYV